MPFYKNLFIIVISIVFVIVIFQYVFHPKLAAEKKHSVFKSEAAEGTEENPLARMEYEWSRLHNPATKEIPKNIAHDELVFARKLADQPGLQKVTDANDWIARGPYNIGGRTKAVAVDITNEQHILAGCVSSGMFKSTDGGASWAKTTKPDQLHSVTCIAQNKSPGKENIWYYGTGDRTPTSVINTAMGPLGTNSFYRGDGIFKSVDGGDTWEQLDATVSGTPDQTDAFDFIWKIVTFGEDGVMAATSSGVFKSINGGKNWTSSLKVGDSNTYPSTEIAVADDGTFYAAIGGTGTGNGYYRSIDQGEHWENISPDNWHASTVRTVLCPAPSNANIVYFFTEVANLQQELWKYEAGTGWTNLTDNLPFDAQLATFGGQMLIIYVKPDNENTIFLGAIDLFRSTDGGGSFEVISGTGPNFHVDQQSIAFYPSNPGKMIVGNDGGLFETNNNLAETTNLSIDWNSLNKGYLTTQFYTVAIDHDTPGSETLIGGTQDNGVVYTSSSDPREPWQILYGGDGAYTAVTDSGKYFYYATAATFKLFRHSFPDGGWQRTEITSAGGQSGLWMTIFQLDPHNQKIMYLPSRRELWRNSDLTEIPYETPNNPTDINWDTFDHVGNNYIHALGMSAAELKRLYYAGSSDDPNIGERVFYIDDPQEGQPVPVDITGENFPYFPYCPYINCIAVDPRDAEKVMVVFPNYGVISIFASDDGGATWTPVSGNLEENSDGSGSGPSVRWISILYVNDQPVYLAGTSVGLFSATKLNGMNTVWAPEALTKIGNIVVDMIDVRQSDGYVAVATHGNGIYSTYINEIPTGTVMQAEQPKTFKLFSAYPNPFNPVTTIKYSILKESDVTIRIYDILGKEITTLVNERKSVGKYSVTFNANNLSSGVYFYRMQAIPKGRQAGSFVSTKKFVLLK